MRASLDFLYAKYDEFNRDIFSSGLPPVEIRLSRAGRSLGYLRSRGHAGRVGNKLYCIFVSTRYDMPERMLEDVLIHEMIHYKIALDGTPDTSVHGNLFRSLMSRINERHGRDIRTSIRLSEDIGNSDNRLSLVYLFSCHAGCHKVFMRCASTRVFDVYGKMTRHPDISDIHIYSSTSQTFNRYRNSRTLKFYELTREIEQELALSRELEIVNGILRPKA